MAGRAKLAIAAAVLLVVTGLVYQLATWPDVRRLAHEDPETTAFIERYRAERRATGEPEELRWQPVRYDRISPHLKRAVVAAEDLEFFRHHGFSSAELKNALREALKQLEVPRGASTITQQLAKNLWLSPSRSPLRKLKEVLLTRQLEKHLSKRRILELYLNVVEFGPGIYGAEAAARHYSGKPASDLTPHEAAQLAASLPRPSAWHPGVASRGYQRYVAEIERRMDWATFLWRALGATPPGPLALDTLPIPEITGDLDSLLRMLVDTPPARRP